VDLAAVRWWGQKLRSALELLSPVIAVLKRSRCYGMGMCGGSNMLCVTVGYEVDQ
jgi:hypothetical protein